MLAGSAWVQSTRILPKDLNGAKPSEIPIETPERLMLGVNRTTAKTIDLKIPHRFLERIDRVVE